MATVEVHPGVCGFTTRVVARANASYGVEVEITSECPRVRELAGRLGMVDALQEFTGAMGDARTYAAASAARLHVSCPVPSGILKAIECAAGLALPADVRITMTRE